MRMTPEAERAELEYRRAQLLDRTIHQVAAGFLVVAMLLLVAVAFQL